jgi:type III secretion protein D
MSSVNYELHVLEGEQQGARTALPAGLPCTISGGFDSDVVLRGAGLAGQRISLTAAGDTLQLRVLEGQAEAAGQLLQPGQTLAVPLDTPVRLGAARIGVVRLAAEAAASSPAAAAVHADVAAVAAPLALTPGRVRSCSRRVAGGGAALAAISVGVLAFAYNVAPQPPTPAQQAHRAQALLHGAGLQRLAVGVAGNGELQVDGYLETAAQRARAEQLMNGAGLQPRWQVFVNEQVAGAVEDVFRTHGVAAQVQATGPGAMRADTAVADPRQLEEIRVVARRDIPGLAALELHNDPRPLQAGPTPAIDDPGKRVASIVPGDPPYVVTADGTRYFEGALLPTGHRIAAIEEQQVVLEINGVKTPLVF